MNNNVQVNLQFTANTAQAKQELANLQTQLTSLINQPVPIGAKMTAEIQQATAAAAELKVHLQNATNVKTGMLDFGKLNQSIKQSGMSLSEYGAKLQALGPQGQQAFMQLANSVAAAEVPIRRAGTALSGMLTTFKNTAKWMVSSTVLNGFIRTMSSAYGYAQDLNESLNNIRIVTGYNIDQMSKFAVEANKAAKALNATTTEYTNASLIYYQQGLSDEQVKQRTDVTIKLANVSRQAAETVSDQMTSVWNNFYDGSKSLEYYADALTALGAATASSTDEIAQGLEKFAAIANTVGLSYEYATAALATVTAQTRLSADVVGTAFKTLFARIQDLELGETLDDGTTLGSYSEALTKVGVNIKDASGELKDMDVILEEMASKWNTLGQAEKTSLAQSVAGVRQYTQLVALMNNWDFMKENLKTVENSTGTLQKQANIYAESWEAASDRVRASAEKVYSALLDDKFFISLNNGLAEVLDSVGAIVKGMGGLKGVISMLGVVVTKVFASQIANGLKNITYNIVNLTAAGREAVQTLKQQEMEAMKRQLKSYEGNNIVDKTMTEAYQEQIGAQQKIMENAEHMSEIEKQIAQTILDQGKALADNAVKYANIRKEAEQQASATAGDIYGMAGKNPAFNKAGGQLKDLGVQAKQVGEIKSVLQSMAQGANLAEGEFNELIAKIDTLSGASDRTKNSMKSFAEAMYNAKDEPADLQLQFSRLQAELQEFTNSTLLSESNIQALAAALKIPEDEIDTLKEKLQQYVAAQEKAGKATATSNAELHKSKTAFEDAGKAAENAKGKVTGWADGVTALASSLMSISMMFSSINSLMDTLTDPDTSGWEKFLAILSSVGMTAMSVISLVSSFAVIKSAVMKKDTEETSKNTAANIANAQSEDMVQKESIETTDAKKVKTKAMQSDTSSTLVDGAEGTYKGRAVKYNQKAKRWTWNDGKKGQGRFATGNTGKVTTAGTVTETVGSGAAGGFGSALASIGLAAAGIAIATVSIYALSEALNEHNAKAAQAAEAAKELAEGYDAAKTSYEELMQTSSNYSNAVTSLSTLTKGTLEYREAILKANDEALKLIENNKNLSYTIGKDGLILIDEESLEKVQEQQLKSLQAAQAASMSGSIKAQQAQLDADSIEFRRDIAKGASGSGGEGDAAQGWGSFGAGAGVGMAIGAIAGPIGAIIGAAIGAVIGGIGGLIWGAVDNDATDAEQKALEDLAKAYREKGELALTKDSILSNVDIKDEELRASLAANVDETAELVKQMVQVEDATRANTLALSKQNLGDDTGSLMANLVGEKTSEISDNIKTVFEEETTRFSDYDTNDTVKDIADRYAKALGKEIKWNIDDTVVEENRQFYLQYQEMVDGKLEDKLVSIDAAAERIGQYEGFEEIEKTSEEYNSAVEQATEALGENLIKNISTAILDENGNFGEELTQENLEQIQALSKDPKALEEFWLKNFGMDLGKYLKYSRYEGDTSAFIADLQNYTETATNKLEDTINSLSPKIQGLFNDLLGGGQFAKVSEKGKTDLVTALNTLMYEESPEIAAELLANLQGMTPEAIEAFVQTLSSQGLRASAQDFNTEFERIAKGMDIGENAISSFISVWTEFSEIINSTCDDLATRIIELRNLKTGDLLSKEDAVKAVYGEDAEAKNYSDAQLRDLGLTKTSSGQWLWNGQVSEKEIQRIIGQQVTKISDAKSDVNNLEYASQNTDELTNKQGFYYTYDIEQSSNEADRLLQNNAEKLNTDINQMLEKGGQSYRLSYDLVDIPEEDRKPGGPTKKIQVSYQRYYPETDTIGQKTSTIDLKDLLAMTSEELETNNIFGTMAAVTGWAQLGNLETIADLEGLTAFINTHGSYAGTSGENFTIETTGYESAYGDRAHNSYKNSFTINENVFRAKANTILQIILATDKAILSDTAIGWVDGMNTIEDFELIQNAPKEHITNETQANAFNNIYTNITKPAIFKEYGEKATTAYNNEVKGLIDQLNANQDYAALAEIAYNGTYQGKAIELDRDNRFAAIRHASTSADDMVVLGEEAGAYEEYLAEQAKNSSKFAKRLLSEEDRLGIKDTATYVLKIQKAFTELQDADYSNLFETLYSGAFNTLSPEYASAKSEFTKFAGELLSLDNEDIDLIKLFADQTNRALLNSLMEGSIDYEEFLASITENYAQANIAGLEEFDNQFTKRLDSFQIGQEATEGFLNNLNKWLIATGNAAQDVNNYLEMQGYRVETNAKGEITYISKLGAELVNFNQYLEDNSDIIDKISKIDIIERYKEVNDQLDDVSRAYENASKAADRLYDQARLNQMIEMNKILANEVNLLSEKRKEAEAYLQTDQTDLNSIARENIGLQFKFDKAGNISNYQEVMEAVWKDYDAYYESAKAGGFSESEQERLDDYDTAINNVKDAISQYDETRELLEDIDDEIQAKLYEMQDNNYERFTYAIDMELEIRDLKLDFNQYQLDKVMTELFEVEATGKFNDLMRERLDLLEEAANFDDLNWLKTQFDLGEKTMSMIKSNELSLANLTAEDLGISQKSYAEGLKNAYNTTMDNINALEEHDELMRSYYGETLAAANEQIEKYTSLMEHGTGILEHYKNLMELTGKGTDYKKIGKILEGEAQIAADTLAVSTAVYENRMNEANTAYAAYQKALTSGASTDTVDMLHETWLTAQNAANEAQEQMLADTEAWAEAQNAILENTLADLGKSFETALAGHFGSFSELSNALERAAASTEEWLTATNKIYETDKLINKAQKDIDNTINTVAKQKLQNYIKETEQLQKRSQLSQFELEIQQAKYDLLLAEIALEEAQNAKSTVRLRRDSEGNFGYVYTADQNAIDDAEQKYQDAENNLYNIRLEGANDYVQKSLELQMQFMDTMQELNERRQNGEFASEQAYENAVLAAKEYYYKQLEDYSYLYGVSISEDTRVVADAWSTEFNSMVIDTKGWKESVENYISEVDKAFGQWQNNISGLYGESGALAQVEDGIERIKNAASALKELLIGADGTQGIVNDTAKATDEGLKYVQEYAKLRDTIVGDGGLISAYEEQLKDITKLIDQLSTLDNTSINVNQTQTYKTVLDTGNFNSSVKDFSAAVREFAGGNAVTAKIDFAGYDYSGTLPQTLSLANSVSSVAAWLMDKSGKQLVRQDDVLLNSTDLAKAKVLDSVHVGGDAGTYMYKVKIGKNEYFIPANVLGMDTGGYTGEWGPEGRLAMLHQKELVLNADDTSNFLSALGLLDNILLTLDKYTVNAQLGGLLNSPGFLMNNSEALEQNVHIEASFPGVTDRNEIEEAFNNLVNRASQYANRK